MIAAARADMQSVLSRIAAIEGRFSTQQVGDAAAGGRDGSFADTLAQASANGRPATGSAFPAPSAASSALATAPTIGVAAPGAGNVRGLSALVPSMSSSTLAPSGSALARAVLPGGAVAGASTATPVSAAPGSGVGEQAVALAKQHLGVPYVWGGEDPSGFDCSGLVQYTFKRLGVNLPRVSRDQARAGTPVASLAQARPGDLVAFGSPVDHIGIYAGDNKMVVAPHTGAHVRVQTISRPVTAIRRVV